MTNSSLSLFYNGPRKDFCLSEALAQRKPGSKAQQRFRELVANIERNREDLRQWQAYERHYNQRVTDELEPARSELLQQQRQLVVLIDELLFQQGQGRHLSQVECSKLRDILMRLLKDVSSQGDDEVLAALRAKHANPSAAEKDQRFEVEFFERLFTNLLGLEMDNHGASSIDELLDHARLKIQQRAQSQRTDERKSGRRAKRSAAEDKKRAKREQAAKEVSQSLRDVFRKLVSALHPDREPDPTERVRKDQLMQRVNQAYDAKDLLTLLGLQLEIEQIDAAHLSSTSAQRLAHYNQILSEQVTRLEEELLRHFERYREVMGPWALHRLTVAEVDRKLTKDISQLHEAVQQLTQDLVVFRDPAQLRARLSEYHLNDGPRAVGATRPMREITAKLDVFRLPRRSRQR